MNPTTTSAPVISSTQAMPAAARRVVSLLQRLQHGTLHVQWPDGRVEQFGSANGEGLRFVRSELAYLWTCAPHLIPSAILRTLAKWLGYKLGRLEAFMPFKIKRMCSMHKGYWRKQADKEQALV